MYVLHEKLDWNKLLKPLGTGLEVQEFKRELELIDSYNQLLFTFNPSLTQKRDGLLKILNNIKNESDALLSALKPITPDTNNDLKCFNAVSDLIEASQTIRRQEQQIRREEQHKKSYDHFPNKDYYQSAILADIIEKPINEWLVEQNHTRASLDANNEPQMDNYQFVYYSDIAVLIGSLNDFMKTVTHAIAQVKSKCRSNNNQSPIDIRKKEFANSFVRAYFNCFKKYPPLTIEGTVSGVFTSIFQAVFPSDKDDDTDEDYFYWLRMAIEDEKSIVALPERIFAQEAITAIKKLPPEAISRIWLGMEISKEHCKDLSEKEYATIILIQQEIRSRSVSAKTTD